MERLTELVPVEKIDWSYFDSTDKEELLGYEERVREGLRTSDEFILNPGLDANEAHDVSVYFSQRGFKIKSITENEITYSLSITRGDSQNA